MSKIKLLLDVVNDIRTLADSLEAIANAIADGDNSIKPSPQKEEEKPNITHEEVRDLAVKLSRKGMRENIKQLIEQYGVQNITAVAEPDLDAFYADLKSMEVE